MHVCVVGDSNALRTSAWILGAHTSAACNAGWTLEQVSAALDKRRGSEEATAYFVFAGMNDAHMNGTALAMAVRGVVDKVCARRTSEHVPVFVAAPFSVTSPSTASKLLKANVWPPGVTLITKHLATDHTLKKTLRTTKPGARGVDPLHMNSTGYMSIANIVNETLASHATSTRRTPPRSAPPASTPPRGSPPAKTMCVKRRACTHAARSTPPASKIIQKKRTTTKSYTTNDKIHLRNIVLEYYQPSGGLLVYLDGPLGEATRHFLDRGTDPAMLFAVNNDKRTCEYLHKLGVNVLNGDIFEQAAALKHIDTLWLDLEQNTVDVKRLANATQHATTVHLVLTCRAAKPCKQMQYSMERLRSVGFQKIWYMLAYTGKEGKDGKRRSWMTHVVGQRR